MQLSRVASPYSNPSVYTPIVGWVNLDDYAYLTGHALGTGTVYDDVAFAAALATGMNVDVPSGTVASPRIYKLQNTYTPAVGQCVRFNGILHVDVNSELYEPYYKTSYVLFCGTNNFLFKLINSYSRIENCFVLQNTTTSGGVLVNGTAGGGHFWLGGSYRPSNYWPVTSGASDDWIAQTPYFTMEPQLINCVSINAHVGCQVDGMTLQSQLFHCQFMNGLVANILVDLAQPMGDLRWVDVMSGWGYRTPVGVYIKALDTSNISFLKLKGCQKPMWLSCETGNCIQMGMSNIDTEGAVYVGDQIVVAGSPSPHYAAFNKFSSWHCAGGGTTGIATVRFGSNSYGNAIENSELYFYNYRDDGVANRFVGNIIHNYGNIGAAAGLNGIDVRGKGAIISANTVNDFAVGFNLAAGATDAAVTGNNFKGSAVTFTGSGSYSYGSLTQNTTATVMDATAKAASRGTGNIGVADW